MSSAKETKTNALVVSSLLDALKRLKTVTTKLHLEYEEPKHDSDNCEVCQAISAAKAMLTIHKA